MELSDNEFESQYRRLRERDDRIIRLEERNRQLEKDLEAVRNECAEWKCKYEQSQLIGSSIDKENVMLRKYLLLSWTKIKEFVTRVGDIRLVSFLQTFLQKTSADEMGVHALEDINKVVELPPLEKREPDITKNYYAPIGQLIDHAQHVEPLKENGGSL